MPARAPGNEISHHPSESIPLEQMQAGVIPNERLTALVSFMLLMLIIVELVTSAVLRSGLLAHTFVKMTVSKQYRYCTHYELQTYFRLIIERSTWIENKRFSKN